MKKHWSDSLVKMKACSEAVEWARTQPSLKTAWKKCRRGDWMLWLLARRKVGRKQIVLAACGCARLALKYVPRGDDRPRFCIETAERWTRGEATIDEVQRARQSATYAAYDAAAAAATAYAATAAYDAYDAAAATAYAATAAYDAAYAADAAAYAADAAAYAAYDAAAALIKTLTRCATIVRKHFKEAPVL